MASVHGLIFSAIKNTSIPILYCYRIQGLSYIIYIVHLTSE